MLAVFQGYMAAAALIIAIGAQNAFVLAQGIKRQHHWAVASVCIFIDACLISLGMLGAGVVINQWPEMLTVLHLGGFLFLSVYGYKAFMAFFHAQGLSAGRAQQDLKSVLLTTLAVSLLNPHVYLDTVVLLGSIGSQYTGEARNGFWIGAVLASLSWFLVLTLLARTLSPWLSKPQVWRWVELLVAMMMWTLAFWLGWGLFDLVR